MVAAAAFPASSTDPRLRPVPEFSPAPARFVFVLSPERSGSTLLSAMLGGHSQVVAPAELHLLRYPTIAAWREAYPAAAVSLESLLDSCGLDRGEIDDSLAPAELYRRIQKLSPRGTLLVDKTPAYARSSEALRAAESLRPLYIWLVRHPLGVAASRVNRMWTRRSAENSAWVPWLKYPAWRARETIRRRTGASARSFAEDWAEVHDRLRRFLRGVDRERVLRIQYEDLVRRPGPQLDALCDFLGIDSEPAMLDPRGNAPKGLRWGVGDENVLRHAGISSSQADAWRKEFGEHLLTSRVRQVGRALGVRLGDDPAAAPVAEPEFIFGTAGPADVPTPQAT